MVELAKVHPTHYVPCSSPGGSAQAADLWAVLTGELVS